MKWDSIIMIVAGLIYFVIATDILITHSLILENIILYV
jgi:hypothetical protein